MRCIVGVLLKRTVVLAEGNNGRGFASNARLDGVIVSNAGSRVVHRKNVKQEKMREHKV